MPTGKDHLNPAGLAKSAKAFLDAQTQVHHLATKIHDSHDFAARLDQAVANNDAAHVHKLLREGGIKEEITRLEMDADRKISFWICFFGACTGFSFEW
jgi:hypothetical protein